MVGPQEGLLGCRHPGINVLGSLSNLEGSAKGEHFPPNTSEILEKRLIWEQEAEALLRCDACFMHVSVLCIMRGGNGRERRFLLSHTKKSKCVFCDFSQLSQPHTQVMVGDNVTTQYCILLFSFYAISQLSLS